MWTDGQCFLQQILSEAHHCIFYNNTNINTNTNTNTNTTTTTTTTTYLLTYSMVQSPS